MAKTRPREPRWDDGLTPEQASKAFAHHEVVMHAPPLDDESMWRIATLLSQPGRQLAVAGGYQERVRRAEEAYAEHRVADDCPVCSAGDCRKCAKGDVLGKVWRPPEAGP